VLPLLLLQRFLAGFLAKITKNQSGSATLVLGATQCPHSLIETLRTSAEAAGARGPPTWAVGIVTRHPQGRSPADQVPVAVVVSGAKGRDYKWLDSQVAIN